jgi:hypothetical protein
MPKRNCKFNEELSTEYPFLKKIGRFEDKVNCMQCGSQFSVANGGRYDIRSHLISTKHKNSLIAIASSSKVSNFFKNSTAGSADLDLAAKEATFAFHTVCHNLSFNSNGCFSQLVSTFFDKKFHLGKTKSETLVLNVLAPLAMEELKDDLNSSSFISVSMDTSNKKEIKLVPIVVRYFLPESGVCVKLLDFKSVPGETANILSNHLMEVLKVNDLCNKIVGFCGDNCNTNFGGVERRGKNNVFAHLKMMLGRDLNGIGCGAHIVHNSFQTAVDVLPIDVEIIVVKIYKYFHIYTVRVTRLKEFCEFAEVEYSKVLKHSNTRFLSLLPAIERLLKIFEGLKSYFNSQELCPAIIKSFFKDDLGELYMWFVHSQLILFNKAILSIEKSKASAVDVAISFEKLLYNLKERQDNLFIPLKAKLILERLEKEGHVDRSKLEKVFYNFYERCISYLKLWEKSLGDALNFSWITENSIEWTSLQESAYKINEKIGKQCINQDELFDEYVLLKEFWESKKEEWKTQSIGSEEKWVQFFTHLKEKDVSVPSLRLLMEYIFSMPGTSAPVERIFSLMNNAWSDDRSLMHESTVKGLLICKMNIQATCTQFYEKIKNNTAFLKKVHSSEKYESL